MRNFSLQKIKIIFYKSWPNLLAIMIAGVLIFTSTIINRQEATHYLNNGSYDKNQTEPPVSDFMQELVKWDKCISELKASSTPSNFISGDKYIDKEMGIEFSMLPGWEVVKYDFSYIYSKPYYQQVLRLTKDDHDLAISVQSIRWEKWGARFEWPLRHLFEEKVFFSHFKTINLDNVDILRPVDYGSLCLKGLNYGEPHYPKVISTGRRAYDDLILFIEKNDSGEYKKDEKGEHVFRTYAPFWSDRGLSVTYGFQTKPPLNDKLVEEMDYMVGTVKTFEPSSYIYKPLDKSNWRKYVNEEYGFEFQYPNMYESISSVKGMDQYLFKEAISHIKINSKDIVMSPEYAKYPSIHVAVVPGLEMKGGPNKSSYDIEKDECFYLDYVGEGMVRKTYPKTSFNNWNGCESGYGDAGTAYNSVFIPIKNLNVNLNVRIDNYDNLFDNVSWDGYNLVKFDDILSTLKFY